MSGVDDVQELITAAKCGDRVALGRLLLDHFDPLYRYIAARIPSLWHGLVSVEDVLQDAFVHATRDIATYEPRPGTPLWHWLKAIVEHRLLDHQKTAERLKRGGGFRRVGHSNDGRSSSAVQLVELLSDGGDTPSGAMARQEAVDAIQLAVGDLPEDQQEAVRRCCLNGDTVDDTAAGMGRTPGAVRGLLHRAKKTLSATLGRSSKWFGRK